MKLRTTWPEEKITHSLSQSAPWPVSHQDCTEETEEPEELQEIEDVSAVVWGAVKEAIDRCTLIQAQTSNALLFQFARELRGIEDALQKALGPSLLQRIFGLWEKRNRQFLQPDHDYFAELSDKLSLVRFPSGFTLASAFQRACTHVPPARASGLGSEAQQVANLCRELQHCAGANRQFYLDGRALAKLLGHQTHSTVASWLRALRRLRVIKLAKKWSRGEPIATYTSHRIERALFVQN